MTNFNIDKGSFDEFKKTMSIFLDFPDVERDMNRTREETLRNIDITTALERSDDTNAIRELLNVSTVRDFKIRLNLLFTLSNGSFELFQNILIAFFGHLRLSTILKDNIAMQEIATFLSEPNTMSNIVPEFSRNRFQLRSDWRTVLMNPTTLHAGIVSSNQILGDYSVKIGLALEDVVKHMVHNLGLSTEKGRWEIVNNKEVDVAIPSLRDPKVVIFCSYQLTSASSMTTKANEQHQCYSGLSVYNRSRPRRERENVLFVNVIDGGGWIRRSGDLRTMFENCDYCFSFKSIGKLHDLLVELFELC